MINKKIILKEKPLSYRYQVCLQDGNSTTDVDIVSPFCLKADFDFQEFIDSMAKSAQAVKFGAQVKSSEIKVDVICVLSSKEENRADDKGLAINIILNNKDGQNERLKEQIMNLIEVPNPCDNKQQNKQILENLLTAALIS
ncbi:hypothetical protein ACPF04_05570 [Campylobacter sp. MOP51]|uniref:hypothetical protein n=1 Tax=Campylobacter canis TaxID=3378588 RepID=UPI003C661F24